MYLWSQRQLMPTTPGIIWQPNGRHYKKNVLQTGVSLGQLQWLNYLQQSDLPIDKNGERLRIEHAYYRGEKKIGDWWCDGYLQKDDTQYFFEYQGNLFAQVGTRLVFSYFYR